MSAGVLTAVDHRHEAQLVAGLEGQRGVEIVRRCADVAELVSVAAARVAEVALVSVSFPGIDRQVVRTLAGHGVSVIGVALPDDEGSERVLRQLGVATIVRADISGGDLVDTIQRRLNGEVAGSDATDDLAWPALDPAGRDAADASTGLGRAGPTPDGRGVVDSLAGVGAAGRWSVDGDPSGGPLSVSADHGGQGPGGGGPGIPAGGGGPAGWSGSRRTALAAAAADPPGVGADRPDGRVIAVWGPIGSPGRTTIAVTLAAHLAQQGVATLLIDADTHGASVGQVLGLIDEAPGVAAAARLSDQGALDLVSLSRVAPEVIPALRVLTGLPRADRWPELRTGAMVDLVAVARRLAAVTIIDCGHSLEDDEELSYDTAAPRRNAATLSALAEADEVLAVGAADPVGLQRLVRGVHDLGAAGVTDRVVVVNKVRTGVAGAAPQKSIREVLSRFSNLPEVDFLPWAPTECDAALWAGRSLVETAPGAPITQAITALAERLVPAGLLTASRGPRRSRGRSQW